jgi:tetrahydromethanopterin S-methyltransferase subunit G
VLLAELDEVKARLAEVEDRLEFAERQLVDAPGRRPLSPKSEA